jgi:hypothetical protein
LALATGFVLAACGAIGGSGPSATLFPRATLESVTVDAKTVAPVTYAVLIDRAYTGDAKRSPSYPWPQASAHRAGDGRGCAAKARSASW